MRRGPGLLAGHPAGHQLATLILARVHRVSLRREANLQPLDTAAGPAGRAGGEEGEKARSHIVVWGLALGGMVAALMLAGGLEAIKTSMVVGALPFSIVMVLMGISVVKAIYRDGIRGIKE